MRSPDHRVVSPARGKGEEGKGLPEGADHGGLEAGGRRAELPGTCDGRSQDSAPDHRRPRRVPRAAAARAFTCPSFPLEGPANSKADNKGSCLKDTGGNKKGLSKGCFGLKLDRIGSMSGLGC